MSIKFISKVLLILLVITSVQASNIGQKEIETYFNVKDLMRCVTFSFKNNEIVATFTNDPNKNINSFKIRSCINYKTNENYITGETNNNYTINNINTKNNICDKYCKAMLIINKYETLSILNYKLNNNLPLNGVEQNIFNTCEDISDNNLGNRIIQFSIEYSDYDYDLLKKIDSEQYTIPYNLRYDYIKILDSSKVNDATEQLKIDLYLQMNNKEEDNEFKIAYKYFIHSLYPRADFSYIIHLNHQDETTVSEYLL